MVITQQETLSIPPASMAALQRVLAPAFPSNSSLIALSHREA